MGVKIIKKTNVCYLRLANLNTFKEFLAADTSHEKFYMMSGVDSIVVRQRNVDKTHSYDVDELDLRQMKFKIGYMHGI